MTARIAINEESKQRWNQEKDAWKLSIDVFGLKSTESKLLSSSVKFNETNYHHNLKSNNTNANSNHKKFKGDEQAEKFIKILTELQIFDVFLDQQFNTVALKRLRAFKIQFGEILLYDFWLFTDEIPNIEEECVKDRIHNAYYVAVEGEL